ncbi:prepronociceptin b [Sardina pilchardus]|uniref:prepronociceptin b n=1 Tax=Sardina pilchardus TaxID=27697 RepID=UPI002E11096C
MKTPLWTLLLLSLGAPARGDCQRDCVSCGLLLPEHQAFSTLVCLLECEAQMSSALTWDLCQATVSQMPVSRQLHEGAMTNRDDYSGPMSLEEGEEEEINQEEEQQQEQQQQPGAAIETRAAEWFRSALEAEQVRDALVDEEEDEERGRERDGKASPDRQGVSGSDLEAAGLHLAKRFGGFIKGRHSYRKLVGRDLAAGAAAAAGGPGAEEEEGRPLQKRYGGFIGIRKSARKWNSQKRVSQLLRQYLSLTGRPGRFNNLSAPGLRRPIDL